MLCSALLPAISSIRLHHTSFIIVPQPATAAQPTAHTAKSPQPTRLHYQQQHPRHRCAAPASVLLLLLAIIAAATVADLLFSSRGAAAAGAAGEEDIRISVTYPTEEEERWLDRWVDKYRAPPPAGQARADSDGDGDDFSVHPATDDESAFLNRIVDGAGGVRREGYEGTIEFVNDRPRLIVDKVRSGASSPSPPSKPKHDDDDGLLRRILDDDEL